MFGTGISREVRSWIWLQTVHVSTRAVHGTAYNGEQIGQGRENVKIYLKEHPEICDEIEKKVRIQYHLLRMKSAGRSRKQKIGREQNKSMTDTGTADRHAESPTASGTDGPDGAGTHENASPGGFSTGTCRGCRLPM